MNPQEMGRRIRTARERQGFSQEEFATLISRDQRAVSEYERGRRRVWATDLPLIARVLDVPILFFFQDDLSPLDLDGLVLEQFHRLASPELKHHAVAILREFSDATEQR